MASMFKHVHEPRCKNPRGKLLCCNGKVKLLTYDFKGKQCGSKQFGHPSLCRAIQLACDAGYSSGLDFHVVEGHAIPGASGVLWWVGRSSDLERWNAQNETKQQVTIYKAIENARNR